MRLRRVLALLMSAAAVTVALAAVPSGAGALIGPDGNLLDRVPWSLSVRASGAVQVKWSIKEGLRGACQDWYEEFGTDTLVVRRPKKAGRGQLFDGSLTAFGRTTGQISRTLSARGGARTEPGCPTVCAASASGRHGPPTGHAADGCLPPAERKIDASGCEPDPRELPRVTFRLSRQLQSRAAIPRSVDAVFSATPRKPYVACGDPPQQALTESLGGIFVPVRLLPKLKRGGMVFGRAKDTYNCEGYPKDDGFKKTTCVVIVDVKAAIFRNG